MPDEIVDREQNELDHSKQLDVHTWSKHPEVDAFIDPIYADVFEGRKAHIRKKHLKVLLLDLYVTWTEDPTLMISVSRNVNDYKARTRYNELHISRLTIDVVDALIDAGLIEQAIGYLDRERKVGRLSRIWPTEKLAEMFANVRFSPLDIGCNENRLTVILRGEDPKGEKTEKDKEYEPTPETERMEEVLRAYNELLRQSFIDVPTLEEARFPREAEGADQRLIVSQRDKFVRRVFNRDSFECGGRFYGGWWQRCPKLFREMIFIDDNPTSEIDFSGLHIVLLYAEKGICYWEAVGGDPYGIAPLDFAPNADEFRQLAKHLMLILINSSTKEAAYGAFRNQMPAGDPKKRLTNDQLAQVTEALAALHPSIADQFGADAGIRLQNTDSKITEIIVKTFLETSVPVLCIHDSYIVPFGYEDHLIDTMHKAFATVTGVHLGNPEAQSVKELSDRVEDLEAALSGWMPYPGLDYQTVNEEAYMKRAMPKRTLRHQREMKQFKEWKEKQGI
ncbi:hypothetical protein [Roseibium album]|uniref:hypothetical protein n=1 Tax=Roseibium album TaxID=311410 RepID=UPI0032967D52